MVPNQPIDVGDYQAQDAPPVRRKVDAPSAAPTVKLRYGSAGAAVAAIFVSILTDQLGWNPGASVLEAVAYLVSLGVGAAIGTVAAGYMPRDYAPANRPK